MSADELATTLPMYRLTECRVPQCAPFLVAHMAGDTDPESELFNSGHDPETPAAQLARQLATSGSRVLDLGAGLGYISLAVAAQGCQVMAVEPSPQRAMLLRAAVRNNDFSQVSVVNFIPSDRITMVKRRDTSGGSLSEIPTITVNDLLMEQAWASVDLVYLNCGGDSVAAVDGMASLLSGINSPPLIVTANRPELMAANRGTQTLRYRLSGYGYRLWLIEQGTLTEVTADDVQPLATAHYLAMKRPLGELSGWKLLPRPGVRQWADRLVKAAKQEANLPGLADELLAGPPQMLAEPRMAALLDQLSRATSHQGFTPRIRRAA